MKITANMMLKLGGVCSMTGGALRILSSFIVYDPDSVALEAFYAAIDVLLLFGIFSIYCAVHHYLGVIGLIGFALASAGIASIVGPDDFKFGIDFYSFGVVAILTGLLVMSLKALAARVLIWPSAMWIASFSLAIAAFLFQFAPFILAAGVAFGGGFLVSGGMLLKRSSSLNSSSGLVEIIDLDSSIR